MKPVLDLMTRGYEILLKLYPENIERNFGREMSYVFHQAGQAAWHRGAISLCSWFLRELLGYAVDLLWAYWDLLIARPGHSQPSSPRPAGLNGMVGFREGLIMDDDRSLKPTNEQAWKMALPPFLLGAGIAVGALIRTDVWYRLPTWQLYLSALIVLAPGIVVGIMGLLALIKRLPVRGISWLGSAFMGFTLFVQVILGELVDDGALRLAPEAEILLSLLFLGVGLALLLLLARRGWSLAGLFTLAAASTLGLSLIQGVTAAPFNRDDIALLAAPLGLAGSVLIYLYLKESAVVQLGIILGMGLLNAGVVLVASSAWDDWLRGQEAANPVLPLLIISTGLLLSGPIVGLLVRKLKQV